MQYTFSRRNQIYKTVNIDLQYLSVKRGFSIEYLFRIQTSHLPYFCFTQPYMNLRIPKGMSLLA